MLFNYRQLISLHTYCHPFTAITAGPIFIATAIFKTSLLLLYLLCHCVNGNCNSGEFFFATSSL